MDMVQMGKALSVLGKTAGSGMLEHAKQSGLAIPPELTDPNAHPSRADPRGLAEHRGAGLPAPSFVLIGRGRIGAGHIVRCARR